MGRGHPTGFDFRDDLRHGISVDPGTVEDFARRMALARKNVHFLSAHDGMLGEWLDHGPETAATTCLILVDVVPYASESLKLARLAKSQADQ